MNACYITRFINRLRSMFERRMFVSTLNWKQCVVSSLLVFDTLNGEQKKLSYHVIVSTAVINIGMCSSRRVCGLHSKAVITFQWQLNALVKK
jgi:hypothetical protein